MALAAEIVQVQSSPEPHAGRAPLLCAACPAHRSGAIARCLLSQANACTQYTHAPEHNLHLATLAVQVLALAA